MVEAGEEPIPIAAAAQTPGRQAKVEKPGDRGAVMAKEALAPSEQEVARAGVTTIPQRNLAPELQEPTILPPSVQSPSHIVGAKAAKPARPALLDEPAPLFDQFDSPHLPGPAHLAVGPRVRTDSPDVNQPIPLPLLGLPALDRVSLDDPTMEISTATALARTPPLRATPAPFVRLVLPNPFENRETVRLRNVPEEDAMPVTATPRK
jgi:hypothetical protein